MSDREPIDAEFVETRSSPWPARACDRCANYAYHGSGVQEPVYVGGVKHHPTCPTLARTNDAFATPTTTAGDKARGVSALLAAGAGVLAEGSRAAGEIATGADEVERGLNRAKNAGERFGGAVAKVGDALKRMGVIGAGGRAPMTRERPARPAAGKAGGR